MAEHTYPGILISFEGGEGCGKTTQRDFLCANLEAWGIEYVLVREPGSTKLGESIRELLLSCDYSPCSRAELLLYEAARAQLVEELIVPALKARKIVVADRFIDSSTAYQGFGRSLGPEFVETLNTFACNGVVPDISFLLASASVNEGLGRATVNAADRIEQESLEFHTRVNNGFEYCALKYPNRIKSCLKGALPSSVAREIIETLCERFPNFFKGCEVEEQEYVRLDERVLGTKARL